MSHELLLVSGAATIDAQRDRQRRVEHAARRVPGAVRHEIMVSGSTTLGLVETDPSGGSWAKMERGTNHVAAVLATTSTGLHSYARGDRRSHLAGAEAGHVRMVAEADGSVTVTTDGVGMVPTFWGNQDGTLMVSTHLASLVSLGLPADADELAALQYLLLLHPLDERTLLRNARVLPAGGTLARSTAGGATVTSQPLFLPGEWGGGDRAAVAAFREAWTSAMQDVADRTSGARAAVGLSGGLDSRAIAGGALAAGISPIAYTYGTSRNREVRVARRVAERLELPHLVLPVTDERLLAGARDAVHRLDGAHSPTMLYDCWFVDQLRALSDVVINGHGGGPVWGDEKAFGITGASNVASSVWSRCTGAAAAVRPLLELGADAFDDVRASLENSLGVWDFEARPDMVMFWNLANRQRRWGNMLVTALRRSGLVVETPFLDSRVLRFSASLSPMQHRNGRLYPRVHREVFAPTADIPRSDDGNSPRRLNHLYWTGDTPLAQQLARLALAHPSAAVRLSVRRGSQQAAAFLSGRSGWTSPVDRAEQAASVFPLNVWARSRPTYTQRLADLVEAGAGMHPALSRDAMTAAAADLRIGRTTYDSAALSKAATLGLWAEDHAARARAFRNLRQFRSEEPSPPSHES